MDLPAANQQRLSRERYARRANGLLAAPSTINRMPYITVQTEDGTVTLPYTAHETIQELKLRMQDMHNYSSKDQRFTYNDGPGPKLVATNDQLAQSFVDKKIRLRHSVSGRKSNVANINHVDRAKLGDGAKFQVGDRISSTVVSKGYEGRQVENSVGKFDGSGKTRGHVGNTYGSDN